MNPANLLMLEMACEHLDDLLDEVVFVGGATVELWVTDPAAPEFRLTEDVDVVVEVTTRQEYYRLENRLRELGFENDQTSGVICRFKRPESDLLLDVMPTEASILGFENRWQAESFSHAVEVALPKGQRIRALPPSYLLATKLEAFDSRHRLDFYGSRDWGDVVTLIDGREELIEELRGSPEAVRTYVADRLRELSGHRNFDSGLEGALPSGPESRDRVDLVILPRIQSLIGG
jgi:Nucleotidyl transferase AbiEii toxin, Type IV TA system